MTDIQTTIFLVDDDASICQATTRLLSAAGFKARTFQSPESLLRSGVLAEAACIILDVNLPGMSGFELASRLQSTGGRHIPLIFVTAHDEPADSAKAVALGALSYLQKPFSADALLAAVREGFLQSVQETINGRAALHSAETRPIPEAALV